MSGGHGGGGLFRHAPDLDTEDQDNQKLSYKAHEGLVDFVDYHAAGKKNPVAVQERVNARLRMVMQKELSHHPPAVGIFSKIGSWFRGDKMAKVRDEILNAEVEKRFGADPKPAARYQVLSRKFQNALIANIKEKNAVAAVTFPHGATDLQKLRLQKQALLALSHQTPPHPVSKKVLRTLQQLIDFKQIEAEELFTAESHTVFDQSRLSAFGATLETMNKPEYDALSALLPENFFYSVKGEVPEAVVAYLESQYRSGMGIVDLQTDIDFVKKNLAPKNNPAEKKEFDDVLSAVADFVKIQTDLMSAYIDAKQLGEDVYQKNILYNQTDAQIRVLEAVPKNAQAANHNAQLKSLNNKLDTITTEKKELLDKRAPLKDNIKRFESSYKTAAEKIQQVLESRCQKKGRDFLPQPPLPDTVPFLRELLSTVSTLPPTIDEKEIFGEMSPPNTAISGHCQRMPSPFEQHVVTDFGFTKAQALKAEVTKEYKSLYAIDIYERIEPYEFLRLMNKAVLVRKGANPDIITTEREARKRTNLLVAKARTKNIFNRSGKLMKVKGKPSQPLASAANMIRYVASLDSQFHVFEELPPDIDEAEFRYFVSEQGITADVLFRFLQIFQKIYMGFQVDQDDGHGHKHKSKVDVNQKDWYFFENLLRIGHDYYDELRSKELESRSGDPKKHLEASQAFLHEQRTKETQLTGNLPSVQEGWQNAVEEFRIEEKERKPVSFYKIWKGLTSLFSRKKKNEDGHEDENDDHGEHH